ncbi:sigma-70 family RNA polymerase sigma factor [Planctobacterium marinum]|uniref:RNA polymerase sigma factor n=1 Tax=Planctobacterium marinum TaxID=1631968 RepID=A0AA48HGI1_9ALTE|nr:RNA polymerase sigma factor [Planctobacterium marinum]
MSLVLALKNLLPTKANNEALMEQYRLTQDARLMEQLYRACGKDLYHFLLTQTEPQQAQEICQLSWLRVIERRNSYRSTGSFKGWLFAIARNLLIDELRKNNRWQTDSDVELSADDSSDATGDDKEALSANLDEALRHLPFHQREAIVLQLEGFCLQEIAEITQCEVEAIKSRLRYGKSKLKALWRQDNV